MDGAGRHVEVAAAQHPGRVARVAHMDIAEDDRRSAAGNASRPAAQGRRPRSSADTPQIQRPRGEARERHRVRASVTQFHGVGGVGGHRLRSVRRHHHGDAKLAVHAEKRMQEVLLGHWVQLGGGFVEQQQARLHRQRAGQRDHLLLAARKPVDGTAEPRLDAEEVRHLGHAPAHRILRHAEVLQAEGQLVPHGIAHDLVLRALRHVTRGGGRLAHVETVHGAAEQGERSRALACRRDGRRAAPQKRGLATAGSPHDQLERALLNAPVERPDARRRPRVSEREAARLHGGRARGRRRRCGRGRRHIRLHAAHCALRSASRRVLGRAIPRAF